jgi:hypothetical protein
MDTNGDRCAEASLFAKLDKSLEGRATQSGKMEFVPVTQSRLFDDRSPQLPHLRLAMFAQIFSLTEINCVGD